MTCHNCGKACATRSECRRVVVRGRAVLLCNACPPTDAPAPPGDRSDGPCEAFLAEDDEAVPLAAGAWA